MGRYLPFITALFAVLLFWLLFSFAKNPQSSPIAQKAIISPTITPTPTISQEDVLAESETNKLVPVVRVVDGDTIVVFQNGRNQTVRLIGINTPETVDPRRGVECFGREASQRAKDYLIDSSVRLEVDPTQGERDRYNRLLRYVFLADGTFFNQLMIEEGYAYEYTYNSPYAYQKEFKTAQEAAMRQQKGLWSTETCNGNV